jgi:hypothetical protein
MGISDWLDEQVADGVDVSQIEIPSEVAFDDTADETVFYEEFNPCGMLCTQNHPYAKIERFGRWYCCKGQDRKAGVHSDQMKWRFHTRDKDLALQTARRRLEA